MNKLQILLIATVSTLFAVSAQATPIIGGPGVVGPTEDIDFSEIVLPDFTPLTNQYNSLGVDFNGVFYNGCTNCIAAQPDGVHPEISNSTNNDFTFFTALTTILFTGNVTDMSFAFAGNGGIFTLSSYLNGGLVESFDFFGDVPNWQTYGFANSLFDEVWISTPTRMLLDNLRYNSAAVPEPGTLALLSLGLAGMGLARRRRKI